MSGIHSVYVTTRSTGTEDLPHIILAFSSVASIEYNVAGVPAGARAVHALAALGSNDGVDRCTLFAGATWSPSEQMVVECERLAPGMHLSFSPTFPLTMAWSYKGKRS
ncbi:hypothetical protein [Sphingomonas sp. 1P08PE]|uniref:hypothetical protein n=1 Tax=Sphingomonas sp. 1P08PE TaxID=554122 RepID=UPI0039A28893